jgi:hypothetical protein
MEQAGDPHRKAENQELTPERRELLRHRIAQYSFDDFLTVFVSTPG